MSAATDTGPLTESVFYVLLSLYEPMHGYAIMQRIGQLSAGRVSMGPGTLYGALNTLAEKGWVRLLPAAEGERKKEYEITDLGRAAVDRELTRLEELVANGRHVIKGEPR